MVDPSGLFGFSLPSLMISVSIGAIIGGIVGGVVTKSWKGAIVGAAIGAAIAAAVYLLIVYWPQVVQFFKWMVNKISKLWINESGHHTVGGRLYGTMMEKLGKGASALEKANYLKSISFWRSWFWEWPVGTVQNILKLFYNPAEFFTWLTPTPAGGIGFGVLILVLIYVYRDKLKELWIDLRTADPVLKIEN